MNLVDSSAWLAFFADTKNASKFQGAIEDTRRLLVPTIVIYEVSKVLLREQGEELAIVAQAHMQQGKILDLTTEIAVNSASISLKCRLPMADSIILASARSHNARLWTQDDDFKGIPQVKYYAAK
jgi:predicted nucleic acid-binding protein